MSELPTVPERDAAQRRVRSAIGRGEYLIAFDDASAALEAHPDDLTLQYLKTLALARAGAADQALHALTSLDLERRAANSDTAVVLQEDIATLRARLTKDRALLAHGPERDRRARHAAELYEAIYASLQRGYSCVNAATMWLVAGDRKRARTLATAALELARNAHTTDDRDSYWNAATEAEAALHLHDEKTAASALQRAAEVAEDDYSALATTRKQLLMVCALQGLDPDVLSPLAVPAVVHYGGHMIAAPGKRGRFTANEEPKMSEAIRSALERRRVGFGFGSLACGADVLFAEALLARGAELHILLPFDREEFKQISVAGGGPSWLERFDTCLTRASSVFYATTGAFLGDDSLFSYCAQLAMGRALVRADFLATSASQIVVWDGQPDPDEAGTAADIRTWHATGNDTEIITVDGTPGQVRERASAPTGSGRVVRAILFGDVKGFSQLPDACITAFLTGVMKPLGEVLERFGPRVLYRNTWGDGLYAVTDTVVTAARCALAMQDVMTALPLEALGLPEHLALRIGAHVGPVFEADDPVRRTGNYYGVEVTRTARIEPRTPEGDVYVTDQFAALLALDAPDDLTCQYVGHIPTAKAYGTFPMYVLKRRH